MLIFKVLVLWHIINTPEILFSLLEAFELSYEELLIFGRMLQKYLHLFNFQHNIIIQVSNIRTFTVINDR